MNPVITLLDVETSPLLGWSWTTYQTNILKIEKPGSIISVAWKQLRDKSTQCVALCDAEDYKPGEVNDEFVVRKAWDVLDNTDVLVTQNGESFDIKKLNTRFVYYGLPAPSAYKSLDTLKVAKKFFRFESNKLDELAKYLGEGQKAATGGLGLWFQCMDGNPKAWATMKRYNCHDVEILERVYLRLLPFAENHPNLNLIANTSKIACSNCLSTKLQKRGFTFTLAGRKQRYQCQSCKSWTTGAYERIKHNEYNSESEEE